MVFGVYEVLLRISYSCFPYFQLFQKNKLRNEEKKKYSKKNLWEIGEAPTPDTGHHTHTHKLTLLWSRKLLPKHLGNSGCLNPALRNKPPRRSKERSVFLAKHDGWAPLVNGHRPPRLAKDLY